MLPAINGKSLLECSEEDFRSILDNPDYKENKYLDYKQTLSILKYDKMNEKQKRQDAIAEFRGDVCAFANANGGYIIYGIGEDGKSIPHEISGITIKDSNTDRFERDIYNWLRPINPCVPSISVGFVLLENGNYIVLIYVRHNLLSPYVYLENEKDYRIYRRVGNLKMPVAYNELRQMFTQTLVLEREIDHFRNERIDYYFSQADGADSKYSKFMILHIIPDRFLDNSNNKPVFILERKGNSFVSVFQSFGTTNGSVPIVEGLKYNDDYGESEGRLYNNGIAEFYCSLTSRIRGDDNNPNVYFPLEDIWRMIEDAITGYVDKIYGHFNAEKLYVGFSVIGCKNALTDLNSFYHNGGMIDRDRLVMNTLVFEEIDGSYKLDFFMKQMKLDYMLSLGAKFAEDTKKLAAEIYGE